MILFSAALTNTSPHSDSLNLPRSYLNARMVGSGTMDYSAGQLFDSRLVSHNLGI